MIIYPNVTLAVCEWIRRRLPIIGAGQPWAGALITDNWDDSEVKKAPWAVIVRNDGGADESIITQSPSVGVTCFGPRAPNGATSEADDLLCERLAQHVAGILRDCAQIGDVNPFADCADLSGPFKVADDRPSYYLAATLVVVGRNI